MYLHLGNDCVISCRHLIGIFDIENTSVSKTTQQYLYAAEKAGKVRYVSMDIPKSFVITDDAVYISPIAAATLTKRAAGKPPRARRGSPSARSAPLG